MIKTVQVQLKETSKRLTYTEVESTYTNGPLFCIHYARTKVDKIPTANIWRVVEEY